VRVDSGTKHAFKWVTARHDSRENRTRSSTRYPVCEATFHGLLHRQHVLNDPTIGSDTSGSTNTEEGHLRLDSDFREKYDHIRRFSENPNDRRQRR